MQPHASVEAPTAPAALRGDRARGVSLVADDTTLSATNAIYAALTGPYGGSPAGGRITLDPLDPRYTRAIAGQLANIDLITRNPAARRSTTPSPRGGLRRSA
nr:hypothetical protein [uncultured Brevundimonas sp.]